MICDWQPVGAGFVCRHCGWQAEAPLDKECQPLAGIPVTLPPQQPLPATKTAYRNPDCRLGPSIEFFARDLAHPHLLEWNLFNSTFLPQMAFDFDGILCEDWTARPKYLARKATIPLIVTGRLEQDRAVSLAWLASHRIQVQELVMWPGSMAERDQPQAISRYKAEHFIASGLGYFVESCPVQAQEIAQFSGKPVICPAAGKVF